jgi:uncharacterized protein involved in type VI secretion and phage assembly
MKMMAKVIDVGDPRSLGRVKVQLVGFDVAYRNSPWAWPCSPLAGAGFGFYFLPQVGDEVWVEKAANGDYVYVGFVWSDNNAKPAD